MPFNPFAKRAELDLGTDKTSYRPGEEVRLLVRVRGEDDLVIEEGRAELVCSNRYTYRDEERDADGDRSVRSITTTDDDSVAVARFLDAGTLRPGDAAERSVALRLPAGAPPTGVGAITALTWKVRVALNVKRASDPDAELPIVVLAPAAGGPDLPPESDAGAAADLAFDLPDRALRTGQRLEGAFLITPRDAIVAQQVRVELVLREEVARGDGNRRDTTVAEATFDDEIDLQPGHPRWFPFVLTVPTDACPSLQTQRTRVGWLLRGVVNRRLRSDHVLLAEMHVANAD